jgi:hypothetical protein
MSTAQSEQQTLSGNPPAGEGAQTATTSPPETQAAKTNSREYVLFEEARSDTWTKIGTVEADTQEEALESLGEQKLKSTQGRFMAIPARFVVPRKPKVTTVTNVAWD